MRQALVLGGTGTVGQAVLAKLASLDVPAVFTYFNNEEKAAQIQATTGHQPRHLDLMNLDSLVTLFDSLEEGGIFPNVFIHCAAFTVPDSLENIEAESWSKMLRINCESALVAAQQMAKRPARKEGSDLVFLGALNKTQAFPLPVHFAASQGALSAMTMALSKELGPRGFRVNQVALGLLNDGLSNDINEALRDDFHRFSSLRRLGTPEEAANAIAFFALGNTYINGRVLSVNGGV